MPAFGMIIPIANDKICVRHLYANFKDAVGHRGVALKNKLWATTSAYTEVEFTAHMDELKRMSSDAHEYLNKINPRGWSRAWFSVLPYMLMMTCLKLLIQMSHNL
jgi:hypothetical protein